MSIATFRVSHDTVHLSKQWDLDRIGFNLKFERIFPTPLPILDRHYPMDPPLFLLKPVHTLFGCNDIVENGPAEGSVRALLVEFGCAGPCMPFAGENAVRIMF